MNSLTTVRYTDGSSRHGSRRRSTSNHASSAAWNLLPCRIRFSATRRTAGAKPPAKPTPIFFVLSALFVANHPMPKKPTSDDEAPKQLSSYMVKLDDAQMDALRAHCQERRWTPFEVAYTRFAYRSEHLKLNVTAYTSGKVVLAGKGTEDFVRDVLEPEITKTPKLGYDEVLNPD